MVALAMLVAAVAVPDQVTFAQVAPIDHEGYLEYQFRTTRNEAGIGSNQHLATWRAQGSTFVWRPYILLLDGDLGLTNETDYVYQVAPITRDLLEGRVMETRPMSKTKRWRVTDIVERAK